MFKIKELHITNFRSWQELHIDDFDNRGLCGVLGINGSGKSSLRQALEYLITDKTSDDLPLDELPRDKDTQCELNIIVHRNDDVISITKYRNHKKKGNSIELSINGNTSLTCKNRADTQKNIDELFNLDNTILSTTTIFSQNSASFPQSKESERKDILYSLVDLSKYHSYKTRATNSTSWISKKIENNEQELLHLEKTCLYLKNKIEELQDKGKTFEKDRLDSVVQLVNKIKELKDTFKEIDTSKEIEEQKSKFILIDSEKYKGLRDEKNKQSGEYRRIEAEIGFLKKQIVSVGDGQCPLLKEECERLIERRDKVLEETNPKLQEFQESLKECMNRIGQIDIEILKIEEDLEINKDIERLIYNLEKKQSDADNHNNIILSKISMMEEKIKELSEVKENPFTSMVANTMKEYNTTQLGIENLKDEFKELEEERKYNLFWVEAFGKSGIPNMKIEGVLDSIESTTNNYLSRMNSNIHVEIDSQKELKSGDVREKISYKVLHPDKNITSYQSFSGGERQRVKLADLLTFNDLFGMFNILFLDEVLELSLDDSGKESVLNLLKEKARELGSVFIVSHDFQISDKLDSYIKIVKEEGISKMLWGNK